MVKQGGVGSRFLLGIGSMLLAAYAHAATITVGTTADDLIDNGNCTLREAVFASNTNSARDLCLAGSAASEDVIQFDWSAIGGPFNFATIVASDPYTINGESLTINGAGGSLTILGSVGKDVFRLSNQAPNTAFRLMNLGVGRGQTAVPGRGVVLLEATGTSIVDLINVTISNQETANSGAGVLIANRSLQVLSIDNSYFSNNRADRGAALGFAYANGNDLMPEPLGSRGEQKGIDLCPPICPNEDPVWDELTRDLTLFIDDTEFVGNQSEIGAASFVRAASDRVDGGGAALTLEIRRSNFEDNTGSFRAGALNIEAKNHGEVDLLIEDSVFRNNQVPLHQFGPDGGAIRLIQEQTIGAATGFHVAELRRNSFIHNQAEIGAALAAYNRELTLVNNVFLDQIVSEDATLNIRPDRNGTHRDMDIQLIGNTWLDNEVLEPTGVSALFVSPHDLAGGNLVLSGNLLYDRTPGSTSRLCFFDVDLGAVQFDQRRNNNVLAGGDLGALCQPAPSDVMAGDLRLMRELTGDDLHPERTTFFGDEPILDAWPGADCLDSDLSPLIRELAGDRQPGGVPINGNATNAAGCDPGAFENPAGRALTVNYVGNGEGEISLDNGLYVNLLNGSGVENYVAGDPVELIPSPDGGSFFNGWTGDCSGAASCQLTMSSNRTVNADFEIGSQVSVAVVGQGSVQSAPAGITCPGTCVFTFRRDGMPITLQANPAPGWVLDQWGLDCTGSAGSQCSLGNTDDYNVNVTFIEVPQYALSVFVGGTGAGNVTSSPAGIACSSQCSAQFEENTLVTLTANPEPGMVFDRWSGACSGSGTCQVTLTQDTSVSAIFDDPQALFNDSLEAALPR